MDFVWAAAGGAAIGMAVAFVIALIRKRIKDPTIDTAVSLMAPFAAYIPAEELRASGVIAVVTAGIILGHKAPVIQDATSRMNERINWETIQFLLENSVFLLIGLQVRSILDGVAESELSPTTIAVFCVGVLLAVILVRPLWVLPGRLLPDQTARPEPEHSRIPGRRPRSSPGRACAGWSPWPPRSSCPKTCPTGRSWSSARSW